MNKTRDSQTELFSPRTRLVQNPILVKSLRLDAPVTSEYITLTLLGPLWLVSWYRVHVFLSHVIMSYHVSFWFVSWCRPTPPSDSCHGDVSRVLLTRVIGSCPRPSDSCHGVVQRHLFGSDRVSYHDVLLSRVTTLRHKSFWLVSWCCVTSLSQTVVTSKLTSLDRWSTVCGPWILM